MRLRNILFALSGLALSAAPAAADPYLGLGYTGLLLNYKDDGGSFAPKFLDGVEANAGWKFGPFLALEANYTYATGTRNDLHLTVQRGSLDALGFIPVPLTGLSLVGTSTAPYSMAARVGTTSIAAIRRPLVAARAAACNTICSATSRCAAWSATNSPALTRSKAVPKWTPG